jgi:hypothetical protein
MRIIKVTVGDKGEVEVDLGGFFNVVERKRIERSLRVAFRKGQTKKTQDTFVERMKKDQIEKSKKVAVAPSRDVGKVPAAVEPQEPSTNN